jgi:tetratricopeptide (TPR) repeat protein
LRSELVNRKQRLEGSDYSWFEGRRLRSIVPRVRNVVRALSVQSLADVTRHIEAGRLAEAEAACRRVLASDPDDAEALHLLGVIANETQKYDVAVAFIGKAIAIDDQRACFHASLGRALRFLWRLNEAVKSCRRALAIDSACADAHYELGATLYQQGHIIQAMEHCRRAIELKPDHAKAHEKLGSAHLLLGDLTAGWSEYEWRLRSRNWLQRLHALGRPLWSGEPLQGARILIHAEMGFGDTLQFVRFAPLVAARGGRVVLQVQLELHRLLSHFPAVEMVIPCGADLPDFVLQCPLASLPHAFGTELATVPAQIPYIKVPRSDTRAWAPRLGGQAPRVGLVWAGEPTQKWDRARSLRRLSLLAPLGEIDGLRFFSLQKGAAAEQASHPPAGLKLVDLSPHLHDFADTAAAIAGLDLVITTDTSVVHLAGALGKPVWIMLAHVADWMYLIGRDDTPWYPTARLFRQPVLGAWEPVIERIAGELRRLVGGDRSVLDPKAADTVSSGGNH